MIKGFILRLQVITFLAIVIVLAVINPKKALQTVADVLDV